MNAKIQIKSDLIRSFGRIFSLLNHFDKANLDKLINKSLENRRFNTKHSYSVIFKNLLATIAANGKKNGAGALLLILHSTADPILRACCLHAGEAVYSFCE